MTKGGLRGPFSRANEVSVEKPESREISEEFTENAGEHFLGGKLGGPPLRLRDMLGGRG